jgi:hypothetical protein
VLIYQGKTLESHGHFGPDSRPWTGAGWQSKADVFVLTRAAASTADLKPPGGLLTFAFDKGQLPTIACVNSATIPLGVDWTGLIAALGDYVNNYFSPVWGTPAHIIDAGSGPIPPGCWGLVFMDDSHQPDALGYHDLTDDGLPLSKVFVRDTLGAGDKVSVTASHEIAEMLVDPAIQLGAQGPDGSTWYAYETADAVEREEFDVNGIAMSNFVFPARGATPKFRNGVSGQRDATRRPVCARNPVGSRRSLDRRFRPIVGIPDFELRPLPHSGDP